MSRGWFNHIQSASSVGGFFAIRATIGGVPSIDGTTTEIWVAGENPQTEWASYSLSSGAIDTTITLTSSLLGTGFALVNQVIWDVQDSVGQARWRTYNAAGSTLATRSRDFGLNSISYELRRGFYAQLDFDTNTIRPTDRLFLPTAASTASVDTPIYPLPNIVFASGSTEHTALAVLGADRTSFIPAADYTGSICVYQHSGNDYRTVWVTDAGAVTFLAGSVSAPDQRRGSAFRYDFWLNGDYVLDFPYLYFLVDAPNMDDASLANHTFEKYQVDLTAETITLLGTIEVPLYGFDTPGLTCQAIAFKPGFLGQFAVI